MNSQRRRKRRQGATALAAAAVMALAGAAPQAGAQTLTVGQDIPIAIAIPPQLDDFGPSVHTQLESRLTQFATGSGMAAVDGMANIVMYPLLVVTDEERTGGLIQNVSLVRLELSLYVKNVRDGALFASTSRNLVGSGRDRDAAVRDAVRGLSGRDDAIREFTRDARVKIVDHYERNCDQIITEGRTMASAGDVQDALALLLAVPGEARTCHERTNDEAVTLFSANETALCTERVRRAEAELALDHFTESIDALVGVSETGPCGQRADEIIASIEAEVGDRAEATSEAELERYRAFTDTIGDGVEADAGPEAADRERVLARAKMEAVIGFNRPSARSFSPDLFRSRS